MNPEFRVEGFNVFNHTVGVPGNANGTSAYEQTAGGAGKPHVVPAAPGP
jgi:hypothetical protein